MVATIPVAIDPMDAAMNVTQRTVYFGQMDVDTWYCALVKGQGKVPFDATSHAQDQRCTAIDLTLNPLPSPRFTPRPMVRNIIAESKDWTGIVRPSLVAIGRDLRSLKGAWVQVEMVPSSRQPYTNAEGKLIQPNMFKFLAVYPGEAECQAARDEMFRSRKESGDLDDLVTPAPAAPSSNGNDAERAMAAKFLPALWANSGKDLTKFGEKLAATAPCNRYFDLTSPEVLAIVSA